MPQTASDNFNRANGGLGSAWSTPTGNFGLTIVSNAVTSPNDPCCGYKNDVTPPNNQYAQLTIGSTVCTVSDNGIGPCVRQATGADTRYLVLGSSVDTIAYRVSAGGYNLLGSGASVATGNTLYLEMQGTAYVAKKNGSNIITTTDANIASGRFGIFGANDAANPNADDWVAGDFVVAGSAGILVPRRLSHARFKM